MADFKRCCQDLYWYLKSAVPALAFDLNWGLRQQPKTCYFERQGQKIGFFLPASYCGKVCILRECMGGTQEIHTGFTFPDTTVVSDRD